MHSPFPCSLVIHECSWNKIPDKKKETNRRRVDLSYIIYISSKRRSKHSLKKTKTAKILYIFENLFQKLVERCRRPQVCITAVLYFWIGDIYFFLKKSYCTRGNTSCYKHAYFLYPTIVKKVKFLHDTVYLLFSFQREYILLQVFILVVTNYRKIDC